MDLLLQNGMIASTLRLVHPIAPSWIPSAFFLQIFCASDPFCSPGNLQNTEKSQARRFSNLHRMHRALLPALMSSQNFPFPSRIESEQRKGGHSGICM